MSAPHALTVAASSLPEAVTRRGLDEAQWRTLQHSLFPGAKTESVLLVIDYCRARKLDPMKKPCHVVPIRVKDAKTGEYEWRDVVMPGIYEYRTTAMRTGNYMGHSAPEYGPTVEQFGVEAPDWVAMTFYRRIHGGRIEFPVRVYFREACATKFDKDKKVHVANERWSKAPIQMLVKCCEAAGLREAFPDEFGGESTAEEMDGRQILDADVVAPMPVIPAAARLSAPSAPTPASSPAPESRPADETPVLESEPAPADPASIGVIVEATPKGDAVFVKLDTGFIAGTRDAAFQQAIGRLLDAKQRVELVCRTPTKAGFAPVIEEINPIVEARA
jgi:phage recombination protein Bet